MSDKKKVQKVGKEGFAIQAGGDIIIQNGPTREEMKNTLSELFEANFYRLTGVAKQVAQESIKEFNEEFIKKLEDENPAGINQAQTPGYMSSLFEAQKGYAKSGDKDLGKLLIDLLIERSKEEIRSTKQLVLDESIITAGKMNTDQLKILSIVFLIKHAFYKNINSNENFGKYLDDFFKPIILNKPPSDTELMYLDYAGCGSIFTKLKIEEAFSSNYGGLFNKGFDINDDLMKNLSSKTKTKMFMPCINEINKLQTIAINKSHLDSSMNQYNIPKEDFHPVRTLFDKSIMSSSEIRKKCIAIRPYFENLYEVWDNSGMQSMRLTSIGIAIGHANVLRTHPDFGDIDIWVN